eukprot:PITA_33067
MQHIVPYTPQQNGVAKRKNQTIKEMANCMLQYKGLSLNFWAEVINCANYKVNRTPAKVLKNTTPEEAWSSIKVDVSDFRVFGSEAWAHIPDEKHKALEHSILGCRLKKSLYGLKKAPRDWYAKMDSFLLDTGFYRCHYDNTIYTKKVGKSLIIHVLYVDDPILIVSDSNLINHVKSSRKNKFEMIDLGHLHYFLGLQVLQSKEGISLSQSKYSLDILRHFHMEDSKPTPSPFQFGAKHSFACTSPEYYATLYHQLVGKLLYLTHTHPDLSFDVGLIAQFMQNPHESHWKVAKRILRYVRGTIQFGIHYSAEASPLLVGFTDFDWATDPNDRKSTAGYIFTLRSRAITWAYKKQSTIYLSSAEKEYLGIVEASKEALWLRQILLEFGFQQQHLTTLWCDNQSAIQLCKHPVQHQRIKHIELHMHFIRKLIHDHVLEVQYCSTDD